MGGSTPAWAGETLPILPSYSLHVFQQKVGNVEFRRLEKKKIIALRYGI